MAYIKLGNKKYIEYIIFLMYTFHCYILWLLILYKEISSIEINSIIIKCG